MRLIRPLTLALALLAAPPLWAKPPRADTPAVEHRVDRLLARLSLADELRLIGGVDGFYTRALPSIGLPRLAMSDGPYGVRVFGRSAAYAGGVGLAASWDTGLARKVGASMGRDARARGVNFLLGPGVNIDRSPLDGRNMEYYGEDPFLAGRMAVGFIDGVQSQGVVATIKHFVANNSEYDRRHTDSIIDERTLHEIYLPAFEMAVKDAHVGAVMGSYNKVNGDYLTENAPISLDILKKQWGFKGIFMSDWGATHDGIKAFKAGLDLEMPTADYMTPKLLEPRLADGTLSRSVLDDKVRRILRTAVRFGFLDRPQKDPLIPLDSAASGQVALTSAREAMTLLKSDGHVLPLDLARIKRIAVIGPDAYPARATAGGSSHVDTWRSRSILGGIVRAAGDRAKVLYDPGLPTPKQVFVDTDFTTADGHAGLQLQVFDNPAFKGPAASDTTVAHVDAWKPELWTASAQHHKTMRWRGRFVPPASGRYLVLAAAASEDAYTLYIDGKPLIAQPRREGQSPRYATLALTAGRPVSVRLDYRPDVSYDRMGLGIVAVDKLVSPMALKMARMADAAVVAVGFDKNSESEAFDRSFQLPWGQEALIEAVAAVNPRTIVTVTSGGAYATDGWLRHVPALLQNWYPGQEGGRAVADVLFGRYNPGGHLPISFDRRWQDDPTYRHYYPAPGSRAGRVRYGEGVFVGYRWYSTHPDAPQPRFAFGYGLSYTRFRFGHLRVSPRVTAAGGVHVSFDVTNVGKRAGAEVAQVYVSDPSARVERPAEELKGFRRVVLAPGQTRRIEMVLDRRALAYWDVHTHAWRVDPGRFRVRVGDASNHTPLTAPFIVERK